ncbi:MAG: phosphotransferase [Micropruina sp.]
MSGWSGERLDAAQSAFVERTLGRLQLMDDLSWGLVDTKVLHLQAAGEDFVLKAAGPGNHHIGREIDAYAKYTASLALHERAGELVAADRASNALIVTYQPGALVEGTTAELDPDVHRQAGVALRVLHQQHARFDAAHERLTTERATAWLDREHRIAPSIEARARRILTAYRPSPVVVVPTHGDWQPRNWLIDAGLLRVIDFGRFDFRPASTDLCRLAVQQWKLSPALEDAFLAGYGDDPRDDQLWRIELLREAIGTAVWAFLVGDTAFEAQGHRMLTEALDRF